MAIVIDPVYEEEYNCLTTDLTGGYPTDVTLPNGSIMYAYNSTTNELESVFKLVEATGTKAWFKIV